MPLRDRPRAPPLVGCLVAMSDDLLALTHESQTLRVFLDPIHGSVEISSLAIGREDVLVKEVRHSPLKDLVLAHGITIPQRQMGTGDLYRQDDSEYHHAEIERLLGGPRGFLSGGQLRPGHEAIVIERRDSSPLGGSGGGPCAFMGSVAANAEGGP